MNLKWRKELIWQEWEWDPIRYTNIKKTYIHPIAAFGSIAAVIVIGIILIIGATP